MIKNLKKTPKYWLTLKDCEIIFNLFIDQIQFDEPVPPFNTRFVGKLDGIIESVRQTYKKKNLNNTVLDAAAAYFNQLVRGHAFRNGNKRMAVLFVHIFLLRHEIDYKLSYKGMYNFAMLLSRVAENGVKADETKNICRKVIADFTKDRKLVI